ncbi:MAG: HYR domain-containing protein, partial [Bacteroidales bacterium]|nr:HYR domain-containing protein [Bacteroidales bacterium]
KAGETIATSPLASNTLCEGESLNVDYTVSGTFNAGNIFTAELSDATGSFATPVAIGTLASTTDGTISCTIPLGTTEGTAYRIRVVSSDPVVTGTDNGSDITINTIPVITCPADVSVSNDAGFCGAVVNYSPATATGEPAPVITYSQDAGTFFPVGTTTVTAIATNSCGSDTCTFTVTVTDNEIPVITCAAEITQQSTPPSSGSVIISTPSLNYYVYNGTYYQFDFTDPIPSGSTLTGVTLNTTVYYPYSTATAENEWIISGTNVGSTYPSAPAGNYTYTTNFSGNIPGYVYGGTNNMRLYSFWNDVNFQNATITLYYFLPGTCNAYVTVPAPTFSDNCPGTSITNDFNSTADATGTYTVGTTTVIWTATDSAGNTNSCTQEITITDNEPPVISCPADINEATATVGETLCGKNVTITDATATDNCALDTIYGIRSDALLLSEPYPVDTTTIKWYAYDEAGNVDSCLQTIIITDGTLPLISCPADISVSNDPGVCGAVVNYTVDYSDNCPGAVLSMTSGLASGSTYPIGTTPHTYFVTDAAGNSAACSFNVTVTDDEDPVITCPSNISADNDAGLCSASITIIDATATDNCNIDTIIGMRSDALPLTDPYPVGATTITWMAYDDAGLTDDCIQTITVSDTATPAIICATDQTQTADPGVCSANVIVTGPAYSDNCSILSLINDFNGTSDASWNYPVDTTFVTWTVTDVNSNTNTCVQTIIVTDDEAPALSFPFYPQTAQDIVNMFPGTPDGEYTLYFGGDPAKPFRAYCHDMTGTPTEYITLQYTGVAYNHSQYLAGGHITGTDVNTYWDKIRFDPLTMTVNTADFLFSTSTGYIDGSGLTQVPYGEAGACNWWGVPGTGNVDLRGTSFAVNDIWIPVGWAQWGSSTVSPDEQVVDFSGGGQCGSNRPSMCLDGGGYCLRLKYYQPTYGTTLSVSYPVNIIQTADSGVCQALVTVPEPSGTDNCGVDTIYNDYTGTDDASGIYPVDTTTITWTVVDVHGNSFSYTQNIIVTDNEPPTIACAPNQSQPSDPGVCTALVTVVPPTVGDNCAVDTLYNDYTSTGDASAVYPLGFTAVTWTVVDIHGNSSTCIQTIEVTDDEAPVITCGSDISQTNDPGVCGAMVSVPPFNGVSCEMTPDFQGYYDPANWLMQQEFGSIGYVDTAGAPASIYMNGGDNYSNSSSVLFYEITIPCDGYINFTWNYQSYDLAPEYDPFGYYIDGIYTQLSDNNGVLIQNGNASIPVATGNTFGFYLSSNNWDGQPVSSSEVFIENFSAPAQVIVPSDAIATDNCGIASITNDYTGTSDASAYYPVDTTTLTWTVTDFSGNSSTCTQTIIVTDDEVPTIICPFSPGGAVRPADADSCSAYIAVPPPLPGDNCAWDYYINDYTGTDDASGTYPVGLTTVTWTVFDIHGNTNTCIDYIEVLDDQPPVAMTMDTTIYLDANGIVGITPAFVNNGSTDNCAIINMTVTPSLFTCTNVGSNTVTLTVYDTHGNLDMVTATVTVIDSIVPVVFCNPATIALDATGNATLLPEQVLNGAYDACETTLMSIAPNTFTCTEVGDNTVTLSVQDVNGNIGTCITTVTVQDNTPPIALCHDLMVYLDATGNAAILASDIDNGSSDACGIDTLTLNTYGFTCENIGLNTVTLFAEDVNGNITSCTSYVIVKDTIRPVALCQDITVQLDSTGNASIIPADVDGGSTDACGIDTMTLNMYDFSCVNVGDNSVILTVTDINGNVSSCTATVTVEDNVPPVALCQDIDLYLDASGNASIIPDDVDGGSSDACGIDNMSVIPNTFTCAEVGDNIVTLEVTDVNGNMSSCTATVNVMDTVPPVALCQNINLQLDEFGNASITSDDIDNGSSDACGIANMSLDVYDFSCTDVGDNSVVLTVTDVNGNVSSCNATVTVLDTVPPVALCQNITIQLDETGNAAIATADVDNGSWDACGIANMVLDVYDFSCTDVGDNSVVLTVTDINGNISSCVANVFVEDLVPPVALCHDITIQLDEFGNASIAAADIDNGSNDACGIDIMTVLPNTFTCGNVGYNPVVLTVTDVNGNSASCAATVTVQDVVPPVAVCQDITVYLDDAGNVSITGADVDNGSSDACGIAFLNVSPNVFTCSHVGDNIVTLTVTDNNMNTTTCTATVTVKDSIAPVALCHDITVYLNVNGNLAIIPEDVDNGSSDACGTTLAVTPNYFDCGSVGPNTVVLTVTDPSGNFSSCVAIVTVVDNIPPQALCQNISIYLDNNGEAAILPEDVDYGSNDACGIASLTVFPNEFLCSNVGENIVTLTATDIYGNVASCSAVVTVLDTIVPVINCPENLAVNTLPGECNATIINLGFPTFADNCVISGVNNDDIDIYPLGFTNVTWVVSDIHGNTSTCIQSVYVESMPLAINDTVITAENTPVIIPILENDLDCGNNLNPASINIFNGPDNGTVTIDYVNGTVTYTPDYLFYGNDQFDYQVCDSTGLCSVATVYVTVEQIINPVLGIAKMLSNVEEMPDHTFNITYMITVENLGNDLLTNIQVTDNLHTVFGWPLKYSIIDPPNTNNTITPNNLFDGNADINLLDASQSYLEVGQNATIVFTVNLEIYGATQEFCNSALGTAFGSLGVYVEDISDNGYISDSDGNGSAGDEGEDDCTPLTITPYDVRFPQAFSPDGDGINDRFMVAGIEEYPDNELTVFNR